MHTKIARKQIYERFRLALPKEVSDVTVKNVVNHCIERVECFFQNDLEMLLDENLTITYGRGNHVIFEIKGFNYINVVRTGKHPMAWIFNEKGELLST